jgi:hypothetical protein
MHGDARRGSLRPGKCCLGLVSILRWIYLRRKLTGKAVKQSTEGLLGVWVFDSGGCRLVLLDLLVSC